MTDGASEAAAGRHEADGLIWRILARAIATLHIAYVAFVAFGAILVLSWPRLMWVHIVAIAWGAATMVFDLGCPLTPWEKTFWRRGGRVPYEEGFLQHHILRNRGDPTTSRRINILLGVGAAVLNLLLYTAL